MFGFGSGAPAAADAPPPPAAPPPAYQPSFMDILQGVLFNGQSPADAAMGARQRNYQTQQNAMMLDALQNASPDQRAAMMLNPGETGKALADRLATHTLSGGQTLVNGGPGGAPFVATTYGLDDKSGRGYAVGPGGLQGTDNSLGGDFKAENGVINSGRLGPQGTYSTPQIMAPGSSGVPFTPSVSGATGGGLPQIAPGSPPAGPPGAPAALPQSAPRGIRNNNFGNLMALPNGQQWNGQTGVDQSGYAVFATPEDGARAAATNLHSYATKHGIDTVAGVISRWAPAQSNNTPAYVSYVAQGMGVDPNQKLNMADPAVQRGLLSGIFHFENGPQQMSAWRAAGQGAQAPQGVPPAAPQGQGGGFGQPFAQGAQPQILSPQEAQAAGFAPGAVVERGADRKLSVVQNPEYGPEQKSTLRNQVLNSDEYKQANAAMSAYKAMIANATTMTGPSAYAMLDTFARAINPGAVARPQVIQTIEQNLGIPAQLVGRLDSAFGKGNLPPQVRQQIIDAVVPFAQSHWDQANSLNQANAGLAQQHGFNAADVTAPLEGRPQGVSVAALAAGIPAPDQRVSGKVYPTPRGPMKWTGSGWLPAGGR